jgi:O-methyltransferase
MMNNETSSVLAIGHRLHDFFRRIGLSAIAKKIAPRTHKKWGDYFAIKRHVEAGGAELIDEDELRREQKRSVEYLLNALGKKTIGEYLEFGVYYGSSLACMYDTLVSLGITQTRLFGFDSFEGLPHSEFKGDQHWDEGDFCSSEHFAKKYLMRRGIEWNRVVLEKGWFCDTLTEEFLQIHGIEKASLIMIDCDMYLSAKQALMFCGSLIKDETIIFFDDWNAGKLAERNEGEKRAFDEFLKEHPQLDAAEFGAYSYQGRNHAKIFRVWVKSHS